jgi:hypothetical protein
MLQGSHTGPSGTQAVNTMTDGPSRGLRTPPPPELWSNVVPTYIV